VLPELISHTEPAGVGVGFGGPVDWRIGKICRSHQIEGWSEFDLAGWLRERTGKPTVVDNDGNVAALGEATCGAGKGFRKVFYITLGSGVGGGLVIGGEIYHGAIPGEAEIGHVRLDKQGTTVESRCSGWAVDARVREAIAAHPSSALARQAEGNAGGEARFLAAALASGDAAAGAILSDLADNLGFGLSHVVQLMHPEIIIIGGGLSQIGEPLRAAVESRLRAFVMEAFLPGPRVALAALGEDAVPVGALRLAGEGV
jgi:glucokinase